MRHNHDSMPPAKKACPRTVKSSEDGGRGFWRRAWRKKKKASEVKPEILRAEAEPVVPRMEAEPGVKWSHTEL